MNDNTLSWLFGFFLTVVLATLACILALGHIEEKTSFGLNGVLAIISVIALGWAHWKFGNGGGNKKDDPK